MGPEEALASALFDAVGGTGLTCYQVVPQARDGGAAAEFPYVRIGRMVLTEWDTKTETGFDFAVRMHSRWRPWSPRSRSGWWRSPCRC